MQYAAVITICKTSSNLGLGQKWNFKWMVFSKGLTNASPCKQINAGSLWGISHGQCYLWIFVEVSNKWYSRSLVLPLFDWVFQLSICDEYPVAWCSMSCISRAPTNDDDWRDSSVWCQTIKIAGQIKQIGKRNRKTFHLHAGLLEFCKLVL